LESDGFKVVVAESKKKTLEILSEGLIPDIVILDLMLEEMDAGFVLAHYIKKIDKDVPIIMITAVTSETGLSFTEQCNHDKKWIKADIILAKPIRYEQLKKEMEKLIK